MAPPARCSCTGQNRARIQAPAGLVPEAETTLTDAEVFGDQEIIDKARQDFAQ